MLCFEFLQVSNLVLHRGHVLLQLLHVLLQGVLVLFIEKTALGERRGETLATQSGKTCHLCERHASIA